MKMTVFTPTYNRAYIIETLYRSLQRQTFTDFEWLVVDDGSNDDTEMLFAKWQQEENAFAIRYYKQQNGGKCRAINRGLELAQGELFYVVDSDDYLTDLALEKAVEWINDLPADGKFCGVVGNRGYSEEVTPNPPVTEPYYEGDFLDRYHGIDGERDCIFFTEIHRKYPYPEFPGEKFMTEAVVWNRMAHDGYKVRFYNDIIWIYEYKEDGLTRAGNRLFMENPRGYGLWFKEKAVFQKVSLKSLLQLYYNFTCELSGRLTSREIASCMGTSSAMISVMQCLHKIRHIGVK